MTPVFLQLDSPGANTQQLLPLLCSLYKKRFLCRTTGRGGAGTTPCGPERLGQASPNTVALLLHDHDPRATLRALHVSGTQFSDGGAVHTLLSCRLSLDLIWLIILPGGDPDLIFWGRSTMKLSHIENVFL